MEETSRAAARPCSGRSGGPAGLRAGLRLYQPVSGLSAQDRRVVVSHLCHRGDPGLPQGHRFLGLLRLLGSAIGAITSAIYLTLLPFHPLGMAITIFATVLICQAFNVPSHARLAAITVIIIMVTASLNAALSPVLNALLRFIESAIGTGVAVFEVLLWGAHRGIHTRAANRP